MLPLAAAMYQGGIRLREITYSVNGTLSDEETSKGISMLLNIYCDNKTIITLSDDIVEKAAALGAINIYESSSQR